MSGRTYKGKCFCGAVELVATGTPLLMAYCHCESCRRWSASPVSSFVRWGLDAVKVATGAEHVATFAKTPRTTRKWCARCGGHLLLEHGDTRVVDIFAAALPGLEFKPREHFHYQEAVLRIVDSLPKNKDLARAAGGSGVLLPS
jgi:hypothetical protein